MIRTGARALIVSAVVLVPVQAYAQDCTARASDIRARILDVRTKLQNVLGPNGKPDPQRWQVLNNTIAAQLAAWDAFIAAKCLVGDPPVDPPPPKISCPAPVTLNSTDGAAIPLTYASPVVSDGKLPVNYSCLPASGSNFGIGQTPVYCTATDVLNRQASCTVTMTVNGPPVNPPVLTLSPASVKDGESATFAWTGLVQPSGLDWASLYKAGASNYQFGWWFYLGACSQTPGSGKASGSCTIPIRTKDVSPGTYEARLLLNDGFTSVATATQTLTVDAQVPPTDEVCGNGIDDDKDGLIDEGCPPPDNGSVTATSCAMTDVRNAVAVAKDGYTLKIPAGRCTYTQSLDLGTKRLIVQGAGIGQTVIVDEVPKGAFSGNTQAVVWTSRPGALSRMTGITFQGGSQQDSFNHGMIAIYGNSDQFRFDHNEVRMTKASGLFIYNFVRGVIDHNTFVVDGWQTGIYVHHNTWNNIGDFGDAAWADASYIGTDQAMVVEDNTFTTAGFGIAIDGWMGGHVTFRHNTCINTAFDNHGTETAGRWRSQRTFEVYENTFTWNNANANWQSLIGIRGGTGVVFNNTATMTNGAFTHYAVDLAYFRQNDRTRLFDPWGYTDGKSVWDGNQDSIGYPGLDQPGRGKGNMMSGVVPTPQAWPQQQADPVYAWANTVNGVTSPMITEAPAIVKEGRDFFNTAKPNYTPLAYPHPLVK